VIIFINIFLNKLNITNVLKKIDLNAQNIDDVLNWCKVNKPDLVVIGPEILLDKGLVDRLIENGINCFGPSQAAAQIECNKAFAKEFMIRNEIPTARYATFTSSMEAKKFVNRAHYKAFVVKASGLAAGKGVIVNYNLNDTCQAIEVILDNKKFGKSGETIIVEELLEGDEISVLAFTDGTCVSIMPFAQDYKRAYENDQGPNTGGMGACCSFTLPIQGYEDKKKDTIQDLKTIMQKAIDGLKNEGLLFVGVLFAGIILTKDGPKVLEFNCRFGDPETESLMPLLDSDLYDIFQACVQHRLANVTIKWKSNLSTCGVVVVSEGYPGSVKKGAVIEGIEDATKLGLIVFHNGTLKKDGKLVTNGGRVLTVVAVSPSLSEAVSLAQQGAQLVKFEGAFYRKDIGRRTVAKLQLSCF